MADEVFLRFGTRIIMVVMICAELNDHNDQRAGFSCHQAFPVNRVKDFDD